MLSNNKLGPYTFANVHVSIDGTLINGWADGDDSLTITRTMDAADIQVGASGEGQLNVYQASPYDISFRTQVSSGINNFFADILASYETGNIIQNRLSIKAKAGTFSFQSYVCLVNHGSLSLGFNADPYVWNFKAASAKVYAGTWGLDRK